MGQSVEDEKVSPKQYIDKPQSHFAKLRLEDEYEVEQNGKYVKGSKAIKLDATRFLSALGDGQSMDRDEMLTIMNSDEVWALDVIEE